MGAREPRGKVEGGMGKEDRHKEGKGGGGRRREKGAHRNEEMEA